MLSLSRFRHSLVGLILRRHPAQSLFPIEEEVLARPSSFAPGGTFAIEEALLEEECALLDLDSK